MLHWKYTMKKEPFPGARVKPVNPYTTFAGFDNDLQNPMNAGAAGGRQVFWSEVNGFPYTLTQMRDNAQKMRDKFVQKNRHQGGARITPGWVGQAVHAIKIFAPNAANSTDHYYIFFKTGDNEIDYETNQTFS